MPVIKTAISIDKNLFHRVKEMANKYHFSKSQIFSQAVEYLIRKDESIDLIKKINKSLVDINLDEENKTVSSFKKLYKKTVKEKW
ncbi:MAG: hypothetical protein A2W19_14515 [Spirochaetes bacterium RBG_16_49_21]|nr:MAG: hypothetical protein A2W19_14515 [Spirochaetes bacterium RBG_16_49_21]